MMKTKYPQLASALLATLITSSVVAAPGGHSHFQEGFQGNVDALPPGRLKEQVQKLPPAAQKRALEWLQRFDIPTEDYEFLNADPEGAIYYTDTVLPDEVEGTEETEATPEAIAPENTFLLHSRPGVSKKVFLDFDGHTISGTAWNNSGVESYYAKAYDTDGSPQTFSDAELSAIAEIWHRVAEDMAAFDIDVTTEDPGGFSSEVGHVLVTASVDSTGTPMPHSSAGGVAYVGVWGESYYTNYLPALVYYDNLGSGFPPYVAEAASHEFGHNLGLGHDGTSNSSYYSGHGSGNTSWAPIMGVGYYNNVTQWSKGEYTDANNQQDDMQIISSQLGYRFDDHAAEQSAATALNVATDGTVLSTTPESDAFNSASDNKGIIESRSDTDLFWFDTGTGDISLTITPAWKAYTRTSRRGANLDIEAKLYNQQGQMITSSDPLDDSYSQINMQLSSGRYFLEISGVDNPSVPYSDYGSLGQYFISGSVQPLSEPDTTAPTPDPMGWSVAPSATSRTSISMTAITAVDESGAVQYRFQCTASNGTNCTTTDWQTSSSYVATDLTPGTEYSYQVKARDLSGNETNGSGISTATTLANALPTANDDSATSAGQNVTIYVLENDTDTDGDVLTISSFTQPANGSVIQNDNNLTFTPNTGFEGITSFNYTISDGFDSATATVTITVEAGNSTPLANDDSAIVAIGGTVTIDVLANDSDPDGDTLQIISWTNGNKGVVSLVNHQLIYEHTSKRGGDSFTYTISDGNGGTSSATVAVEISRNAGGDDDSGSGGGGGNTKCHPKKGCS